MRLIRSDALDRDVSVLGFGAAAVLGRAGRRESLLALETAHDAGINFFDTARSYGYGESEGLLGEFFQGRRHSVVISTKFGIVPSRQSSWKQVAKPMARMLLRAVPGVRKNLRKHVAAQFHPGQFTVPILMSSVEESLKKLRTDYIDILLMHEATRSAIHDDELLSAMTALRQSGKVRVIGVSADPDVAEEAAANAGFGALQFASHVGNGFARVALAAETPALRIANHPFGGATGAASLRLNLAKLASNESVPEPLRAKLRDEHSDGQGDKHGELLADVALNLALGDNTNERNNIVLATMMEPAHLRVNAAAVTTSRFDAHERNELRSLLTGLPGRMQED